MSDLYLITPPKFQLDTFIETLKSALDSGHISALQLRLKDDNEIAPTNDIIKQNAQKIIPLCHQYNVSFILNDNPALAKEIGADGVHIGENDCAIELARKQISADMVLGVSCYDSIDRAISAADNGANYVAFGAFYHTNTKKHIRRPSLDILEFWQRNSNIPSVAIGGIKPHNVAPIIKAGADIIAVVTGIWNHQNGAQQAVEEYISAMKI